MSGQSVSCTPPLTAAWLGTLTRYCKSAEAHRQHQERDGHAFTVGVAHHQQQGGLHAKACGVQRSEVRQMSTPGAKLRDRADAASPPQFMILRTMVVDMMLWVRR